MKRQTPFEKWLERAGYQHLRGVEGKDAVKLILRESFNAGRRSKRK